MVSWIPSRRPVRSTRWSRAVARAGGMSRALLLSAATGVVLGACGDLFVAPAPPAPAALGVSFSLLGDQSAAGGTADAFDKANLLHLRVTRNDVVVKDTVVALLSGEQETRVRLNVQPEQEEESMQVAVELLADADALFRGSATVVVRSGGRTDTPIELEPIPAAIVASPPSARLSSLGDEIQLSAAVTFATGDTITGAVVQWSSENPSVASVTADGLVTAVSNGAVDVTAEHGQLSAAVGIAVRQDAAVILFDTDAVELARGQTLQLVPVVLDELENPIADAIIEAWTSSAPQIASVDAGGQVTAEGPGSALITASIGEVSGSITVAVTASAPTVTTGPATEVDTTSATVSGTVNPNGLETEAWFEYGTSEALILSSARIVGSEEFDHLLTEELTGLSEGTTYQYRIVARNAVGLTQGEVLTFQTTSRTLPPGPPILRASIDDPFVLLQWEPTGGPADLFEIERRTGSRGDWVEVGTTLVESGSPEGEGDGSNPYQFGDSPGGGRFDYRVRACSSLGCSPYSNVEAVELQPQAPTVETGAVTDIASNTATYHGYIAPNGSPTFWWFEISESENFVEPESCYPFTEDPLDTESDWEISCENDWPGLAGDRTYWVRLVAVNDVGRSTGEVVSFTTLPAGPPTITTGDAAYDDVWPVEVQASGSGNGANLLVWIEYSMYPEFDVLESTDTLFIPYESAEFSELFYISELPFFTTYYRAAGDNGVAEVRGDVRMIELDDAIETFSRSQAEVARPTTQESAVIMESQRQGTGSATRSAMSAPTGPRVRTPARSPLRR
jgi:hypothetical protein